MNIIALEEGQILQPTVGDPWKDTPGREEAAAQFCAEQNVRQRAQELETDGDPRSTKRHPVKVRMPSGAVIEVGGECLVTSLKNGGQPVEV